MEIEEIPPPIPVSKEPSPLNELAVTIPETNASPTTCSFDVGVVVPMPT